MTVRDILADIHALEEELLGFERAYGIRSETLYAACMSGKEPEQEEWMLDFGEWASIYRTWLTRQADYRISPPFPRRFSQRFRVNRTKRSSAMFGNGKD